MSFLYSFRQGFIQMSSGAKLLVLIFIIVLFFLISSILAILIAMPLYHMDLDALSRILKDPDIANIGVIKFFQIFQSIFLFIVPALLAAWLFSEKGIDYLKANRKTSAVSLSLVLLSLLAAVPIMNMITVINANLDLPPWLDRIENEMKLWEESAGKLTELFLKSNSNGDLAVNFLMIAILPAIGEEFIFRGHLQRLVSDLTRNSHAGILITAFLFSFIHLQFYGFLPRFLLGLYFGYLMFWSGSIWVPVTGHLINNGLAVFYYHFAHDPVGEITMDTIGTSGESNYLLYLSVFLTSLFIGMIYLHEKSNRENSLNRDFL